MALVGRPPPVKGLKFLVKAGSPEPVITRHLWAADESTRPVAAGAEALTESTASEASAAVATASERVGRVRIGVLSHPAGRVISRRFRPVAVSVSGTDISLNAPSQAHFSTSSSRD